MPSSPKSLFSNEPFPPPKSASSAWIYAHCDGGSRGNPGPSGFGAVVTDAHGSTLAELSEFLGIRTNNFAEYSGLLAVLAYAIKHGHRRLKVVSDSLLMVKQVEGKYKVNSPDLKPLWQEARRQIAQLEAFEISHALRHKNKEADALANQAMDRGMKRGSGEGSKVESSTIAALPLRPPIPPSSSPREVLPKKDQKETTLPPGLAAAESTAPAMHRGFTKNGTIHLLGAARLPDGIFVKIIPE